jgi:uncharacterized membrane protein YkvA (DUF1232 family)
MQITLRPVTSRVIKPSNRPPDKRSADRLQGLASFSLCHMSGRSKHHREARGFLRETLMLFPNLIKLLYRLMGDSRVPLAEKALLVGVIAYVISPLDFIPDFIPFVGEVDDLYLVALVLLRLMTRTRGEVLNSHWDGPGDLARLVDRDCHRGALCIAKGVQRVLLGKVAIAPGVNGGIVTSPGLPPESFSENLKDAGAKKQA